MMRPWFPHPMWNLWPWKRVNVKCGCKSRQQVMPLKSTWMRIVQHPLNRKTKVWILCFEFAYNPLRFCLARETDKKMTRPKRQFLNNKMDCNTNLQDFQVPIGYFCISLQVLYNSGSCYICVSVSLERKSERIERKFKTQNPILRGWMGPSNSQKCPSIQTFGWDRPIYSQWNTPKTRSQGQPYSRGRRHLETQHWNFQYQRKSTTIFLLAMFQAS